jgi:hypothetical protein
MKDWKTTVGGIIGAIGAAIVTYSTQIEGDASLYALIGGVLTSVGVFLIGKQASDKKDGGAIPPDKKK